ncbi:hypothetical protein, partial [Geodermatophilus maliterrae]
MAVSTAEAEGAPAVVAGGVGFDDGVPVVVERLDEVDGELLDGELFGEPDEDGLPELDDGLLA